MSFHLMSYLAVTVHLLTALSALATASQTTLAAPRYNTNHGLRFTRHGTFHITVFEDLHFGEAEDLEWGPEQDVNTTRVMNTVLDCEDSQLVVLNGGMYALSERSGLCSNIKSPCQISLLARTHIRKTAPITLTVLCSPCWIAIFSGHQRMVTMTVTSTSPATAC